MCCGCSRRATASSERLTALVNNVGHRRDADASGNVWTAKRIQRIFSTNVISAVRLRPRSGAPHVYETWRGLGGAIVNVSSGAARLGSPGEYVDYAASKGAMDTLTIGLAKEVAEEGIRVNAVRPGFIYTEFHASGGEPNRVDRVKASVPMKRGGSAEEVAKSYPLAAF